METIKQAIKRVCEKGIYEESYPFTEEDIDNIFFNIDESGLLTEFVDEDLFDFVYNYFENKED